MVSETKIYNIKEFIRHNESGELDKAKSLKIIHKLIATASHHRHHNIMIDMRETVLKWSDLQTILELATEIGRYKNTLTNKIASVVPDTPERMHTAGFLHGCLDLSGIQYQVFTDFEEAVEWLSDAITLHREE